MLYIIHYRASQNMYEKYDSGAEEHIFWNYTHGKQPIG